MKTRSIASSSDENDPRPWADIKVTDGDLTVVVNALNGVLPFREKQEQAQGRVLSDTVRNSLKGKRRPIPTTHKLGLSTAKRDPNEEFDSTRPELADEIHVLAVTIDGDVEFVPFSRQNRFYYAHLGWYDPKTREWDVLQFIDMTPPITP